MYISISSLSSSHKITRLTKRDVCVCVWRDRRSRNLVHRKCRCIYLYKRKKKEKKVIRSIRTMEELYEIFNYQSNYLKVYVYTYVYTHTLVQLCLCRSRTLYQWIDPITHQWTGKKRAKNDSMDDDDERYSLPDVYIHMHFFLFDSTFISFPFYSLSFWTNRQAMKKKKAGMVFVIYLTCLYIIHTYRFDYMKQKPRQWGRDYECLEYSILFVIHLSIKVKWYTYD
jgi:hypothetical protein